MFKKLLKGLDSTPSTPKIGRIELPEVGEGDVFYISTSEASAIGKDWSSDSEDSSSPRSPFGAWRRPSTPQPDNLKTWRKTATPQPASPLSPRRGSSSSQSEGWKPINRTSTPQQDIKAGCSRTSSPQPGLSRSTERCPSPASVKPPRKGILKPMPPPEPVTLHWLLLPYDPARSKKLIYFDIAHDPRLIRDHSNMPPVLLKSTDLEKLASEIPLSEMSIRCAQLPHWDIHVTPSGPGGIRCKDVYRAIYETFHQQLSPMEKEYYIPAERLARCEAYFRKRCKASQTLRGFEENQGMRRVDLLEGRAIFMGLRRPVEADGKPDQYWVLELGLPKGSR
ncbi:uncharacterized protein FIBRA_01768 [Fibroporia radiculosa]|uniref:DUF6699 domain-containing protein n=1 Tax=Fibroporia radiculosa TaxID=599839 RepID=J4I8P0_9APHY|nr:uncharacterized protein FIBRA_01768 [Fibroporia radiculosa]CCL99746.1 predicted protein [Fibroporia radiculosa]